MTREKKLKLWLKISVLSHLHNVEFIIILWSDMDEKETNLSHGDAFYAFVLEVD